ncbi:MAG TPA: alpha/beta hydrolase [Acidimicrobiales bacterium]
MRDLARVPTDPLPDRCTTPDGLGIAVYDFGGQGPDLVLVHATGFCAAPFWPLARRLGRRFRCWSLDLRGHGRSDRPSDGDFAWSGFATDVLAVVDQLGLDRPFGFGHSCGGAAVLLAEERRPGAFRSLYCFEPVVMSGPARARMAGRNPLAEGARRRRPSFPWAEAALANYSSKPPFADLDPEALEQYVDAGLEVIPAEDGGDGRAVRLRCRREDEADIFTAAMFHPAFEHLPEITGPVTLCCGADTDAFGVPFIEAAAAEIPRSRTEILPGMGHFGPLQAPGAVADSVVQALRADPGPEGGGPASGGGASGHVDGTPSS